MFTLNAFSPDGNTYSWQDVDNVLAQEFANLSPVVAPLAAYFPQVGAEPTIDWNPAKTIQQLKDIRVAFEPKQQEIAQEGPQEELKVSVDLATLQKNTTIGYTTIDNEPWIRIYAAPQPANPNLPRLDELITFCEQTQEHQAELTAVQQ